MEDRLVMERFRMLERIGSGGMGTVYRAFDERLKRQVAVKEIDGAHAERVTREAQAAARLNHPGIVTLYELGAVGERAVLVSELVEGPTLSELAGAGELSDRDVAELGADVCEALAHAHARGVVHRDIKPQNIIVRADDGAGRRAKLMDFGIASVAGAAALTASGEVVGTLAYMAPEQAEGAPAGEPADVYSLALTMYECWAGFNPVACSTPAATARAIGRGVPSLGIERPDLPGLLVECVDDCLAAEPELRPPLEALRGALAATLVELDGARPPRILRQDAGERDASLWAGLTRLGAVLAAAAAAAWLGGPAGQPALAALLAVTLGLGAALLGVAGRLVAPLAACALAALALAGVDALIGPAALGAAALGFTPVLRLRHPALAVLAALIWTAGLDAVVGVVGTGGIAGPPQLLALLAVVAVLVEFRGRRLEPPRRTAATVPRPGTA